jgi:3-hydroxyisobutyrate dehydrogenase-like beta-hydroxyacid dehydrogenase
MAERVGFIGLGNMGGRMTRVLVDAGHAVVGYDPESTRVTDAGAEPAASPAAVTEQTEVVLLSLPDSPVVERVVRGDDGVLGAARDGQVIVDLSTANPKSTAELHRELGEKGAELLDAGISGGAAAAEKGTLTLMTGGSEQALERVRPILDVISSKIFHMGGPGAGHVAKLLNNFLNGVSLSATAEVMVAAKKAGLELHTFLDVLNASSGVNFATLNRFPKIVDGDYLEGGLSGDLMMKDLLLYMEYVQGIGTPSINAAGSVASFGLAARLGYGDQISNRVVDALGDLAGGIRLHDPTN